MYYKVVTNDMKSLGLRKNPTIMKFSSDWTYEPFPKVGNMDNGGIWVANGKSQATILQKYMLSKGIPTILFSVEIGKILYSNSYRTKTDKVKLINEIRRIE